MVFLDELLNLVSSKESHHLDQLNLLPHNLPESLSSQSKYFLVAFSVQEFYEFDFFLFLQLQVLLLVRLF